MTTDPLLPASHGMDSPYPREGTLSRALLANAVFSAASGALLLGAADLFAPALRPLPPLGLQVTGAGLVSFGVFVAWLSARRPVHTVAAAFVTGADGAWVVASLVALLLWSGEWSTAGATAVVVVASLVILFALFQLQGLAEFARNRGGRSGARSRFALARTVPDPPEVVWPRIRQMDRIGDHFPALDEVTVRSEGGVTTRTCSTASGGIWSEKVVALDDDQRSLVLRFDLTDARFPLPATEMLGGWRVQPDGAGSRVVLWYEYTLRGGWGGDLLAALADPMFRRQMGPVLESMGGRRSGTAANGGPAGVPGASNAERGSRA